MKKMTLDPKTKQAARMFLEKIAAHYDLMFAILFGSRARSTHHPDSDADIAVILKGKPANFIDTKLALDDFAFDVLLDTEIRIQPLPIWIEEWDHPDKYRNPRLLENIRREGIIL